MKITSQKQHNIEPGTEIDIKMTYGGKTLHTKGFVKQLMNDAMIIELDVDNKKMTIPLGADIYVLRDRLLYKVTDSKDFPEIKIIKVDRREHTRVDDVLKIDFKKISHNEEDKYENQPKIILDDIFGKSLKVPETDDVSLKLLYKLIYQANLKMDRILDILESRESKKYKSSENEYVNISGSGMRFLTGYYFSVDDIIALRISLPLDVPTQINILGKVVSVTKSKTGDMNNISIKFIELPDNDRELIIRYVFQKQRELLRQNEEGNRQPQ